MTAKTNKTDVLSDNDLDKIANLLNTAFDERLEPLATKDSVAETVKNAVSASEHRLKSYIDEGIETVMEGIDNLSKQLAEKEKLEQLEKDMVIVKEKLGIKS